MQDVYFTKENTLRINHLLEDIRNDIEIKMVMDESDGIATPEAAEYIEFLQDKALKLMLFLTFKLI